MPSHYLQDSIDRYHYQARRRTSDGRECVNIDSEKT